MMIYNPSDIASGWVDKTIDLKDRRIHPVQIKPDFSHEEEYSKLWDSIVNVFIQLQFKTSSYVSTQKVINSYLDISTKQPINPQIQQDSSNVLMNILTRLEDYLNMRNAPNIIKKLFKPVIITRFSCENNQRYCNDNVQFEANDEYLFPITVFGYKNLFESLENFVSAKTSNRTCDFCKEKLIEKNCISSLPNSLVFQLHRYHDKNKILDEFTFPLNNLDMFKYTTEYTTGNKNGKNIRGEVYYMYILMGVIIHSGASLNAGHYYSYVRDRRDLNVWYCLNDENVKKVEKDDMLENFYGGMKKGVVNLFGLKKEDLMNQHTGMILFYERKVPLDIYGGERSVSKGEIPPSFPLLTPGFLKEMKNSDLKKNISKGYDQFMIKCGIKGDKEEIIKEVNDLKVEKIFKIFEEIFDNSFFDRFIENDIIKTDFNDSFTNSVYHYESPVANEKCCFLWEWINFVVNMYCLLPDRSSLQKEYLKKIKEIIFKNRYLLIFFVWYSMKGEAFLMQPLSEFNLNTYFGLVDFSSYPCLYSKCVNNNGNPMYDRLFDFLIENLLSDINFSKDELLFVLVVDCLIEIWKYPACDSSSSLNKISNLCQSFIKKLEKCELKYVNYFLQRVAPTNENIREDMLFHTPFFDIVYCGLDIMINNYKKKETVQKLFSDVITSKILTGNNENVVKFRNLVCN
jgi:hypothetical protein